MGNSAPVSNDASGAGYDGDDDRYLSADLAAPCPAVDSVANGSTRCHSCRRRYLLKSVHAAEPSCPQWKNEKQRCLHRIIRVSALYRLPSGWRDTHTRQSSAISRGEYLHGATIHAASNIAVVGCGEVQRQLMAISRAEYLLTSRPSYPAMTRGEYSREITEKLARFRTPRYSTARSPTHRILDGWRVTFDLTM